MRAESAPVPEHRCVLSDGSVATLRRLRPTDRLRVEQLHGGSSDRALTRRFGILGADRGRRYADHLCEVPDADGLVGGTGAGEPPPISVVAETDGRIVGVVSAEPVVAQIREAELGVLIADDRHHIGLATALIEQLAGELRSGGIDVLLAVLLQGNPAMWEVLRDLGYPLTRLDLGGDLEVRVDLRAPPAPRWPTRPT